MNSYILKLELIWFQIYTGCNVLGAFQSKFLCTKK